MVQAFLRLCAITLGVLLVCFLGASFVRWMGEKQAFKVPPHPWFERAEWNIWEADSKTVCTTPNIETSLPDPKWIVGVQLVQHGDKWVLACDPEIEVQKFFQQQAHKDWMLIFKGSSTRGLDGLIKELEPLNRSKFFAAKADSQKVSIYLRKKQPQWLFAADRSSLLRYYLFASLWIETAIDFWPDFVVVEKEDAARWNSRLANEMQRRQKRLIWHENAGEHGADTPVPDSVSTQGVMTNRPTERTILPN